MLETIISQYGLFGFFLASFIGSTIFLPFAVELFFPIPIAYGLNPYLIVIVTTLGALLGTWINYALGVTGSRIIEKRMDQGKINHAKRIMDRYGWFGLFIIIALPLPIPLPVDPITIIPGITRMNFLEFSIVVFLGKLTKYSIFIGLLDTLF